MNALEVDLEKSLLEYDTLGKDFYYFPRTYPDLWSKVLAATKKFENHPQFPEYIPTPRERIALIFSHLDDYPTCGFCGEYTNFNKSTGEYYTYCSNSCHKSLQLLGKPRKDFEYLEYLKAVANYMEANPRSKHTPFINLINEIATKNSTSIRETIYKLVNNVEDAPKCYCGASVAFNDKAKSYNSFCSPKCAGKSETSKQKTKETCLTKYGVESHNQLKSHIDACKSTCLAKYGEESYSQTDEFKLRYQNTCSQRWGVSNFAKHPTYHERVKATSSKAYGRMYFTQRHIPQESLEILKDIHRLKTLFEECDSNVATLANNLGISISYARRVLDRFEIPRPLKSKSFLEMWTSNWLKSLGVSDIEFNNRSILNGKEIDILLPKYNLGIELNGLLWHSTYFKHHHDNPNYHQTKTVTAATKGIQLIQIFEDDWWSKWSLFENKILAALNKLPTLEGQPYIRNLTRIAVESFWDSYCLDKTSFQWGALKGLFIGQELMAITSTVQQGDDVTLYFVENFKVPTALTLLIDEIRRDSDRLCGILRQCNQEVLHYYQPLSIYPVENKDLLDYGFEYKGLAPAKCIKTITKQLSTYNSSGVTVGKIYNCGYSKYELAMSLTNINGVSRGSKR